MRDRSATRFSNAALLMRVDIGCLGHTERSESVDYDQTVFVCRWQRTSRQAVLASLDRLRDYGANVAGVVVTMVDQNSALQFDGDYGRRERQLISRLYGS